MKEPLGVAAVRMRSNSLPRVCVSHQLTILQGVNELRVLTGQDGTRQVQHHADRRQQHEEGDLWRDRKRGGADCQVRDLLEEKQTEQDVE